MAIKATLILPEPPRDTDTEGMCGETGRSDDAHKTHTAALMLLAEARVRVRDWEALEGTPEQAAYRNLALDSLRRIEVRARRPRSCLARLRVSTC
jgi:hypothetical protein